jgi:hypothetical protein
MRIHTHHESRLDEKAVVARQRDRCGSGGRRPHDWNCPVLMKLAPDSVAWTCANCGAIVTTPVGAARPAGSPTAGG